MVSIIASCVSCTEYSPRRLIEETVHVLKLDKIGYSSVSTDMLTAPGYNNLIRTSFAVGKRAKIFSLKSSGGPVCFFDCGYAIWALYKNFSIFTEAADSGLWLPWDQDRYYIKKKNRGALDNQFWCHLHFLMRLRRYQRLRRWRDGFGRLRRSWSMCWQRLWFRRLWRCRELWRFSDCWSAATSW